MSEEFGPFAGARVIVEKGDITTSSTDAIVNAANSSLMGGGGVDGAIHRAGGSDILAECKQIRSSKYPDGLPTGEAVSTTAGKLDARRVIHTVGPVWNGGEKGEPEELGRAFRNSLRLAAAEGLESIAFPAISCGVYGYPERDAAHVAFSAIKEFLTEQESSLKEVRLVLFGNTSYRNFSDVASEVLS